METVSAETEKYGNTVYAGRDGHRKAKIHMELNLLKDMKGNKKGFYKYYQQQKEE